MTIKQNVWKIFADSAEQQALYGLTVPVQKVGIDNLTVEIDDKKEIIGKEDLPPLKPAHAEGEEYAPDNVAVEVLEIRAVYFAEGNKWQFFDGSGVI